jgi:hypothetical protein
LLSNHRANRIFAGCDNAVGKATPPYDQEFPVVKERGAIFTGIQAVPTPALCAGLSSKADDRDCVTIHADLGARDLTIDDCAETATVGRHAPNGRIAGQADRHKGMPGSFEN